MGATGSHICRASGHRATVAAAVLRRELRDLLDIQSSNFDSYQSHSTLGYRLVKPIAQDYPKMEELAEKVRRMFTGDPAYVTMEHPAFNLFDDMLAFPQLWLMPQA